MDHNELYRLVIDCYNGRYKDDQLSLGFAESQEEEIFEALIKVFEMKGFHEQEYAGSLLKRYKPRGNEGLKNTIMRVLENYNLSVEEFPHYLSLLYGREIVVGVLEDILKNENITEKEKQSVLSMKFFLPDKEKWKMEEEKDLTNL